MIRVLQVMATVMLLSLPQTDTVRQDTSGITVLSAFHLEPLHWRQTRIFPRWEDTYEVVFEQEMLA